MRGICEKRGQQELVGFVLIVVLVVVALMIFLIISLNRPVISVDSKSAESMLSTIMGYTSDCIVAEPHRETIRELIEEVYSEEKKCINLNRMESDYLNETLVSILNDLQMADPTISSIQMHAYWENSEETERSDIFLIGKKCVGGTLRGENSAIYVNSGQIHVLLELCSERID